MERVLKTINRYNGNLCFVGVTDTEAVVFEVDRSDRTLQSQTSSKYINGLCHRDGSSYMLGFSDNWIGLYSNGVLNETYINTGLPRVDRLVSRRDGVYYALNRLTATIYRFTVGPFVIDWSYQVKVPVNSSQRQGELIVRESDDILLYYDEEMIYCIGDLVTVGSVINKIEIDNAGDFFVEATGEHNPVYSFLRWRQVSEGELDQSSSSSSYSSSSSSSFGNTSSSSSSSFGYTSTSSSSSLGESSSSSLGKSSSSSLGKSSSSSSLGESSSSSFGESSSSSSLGYSSESSASAYGSWECVSGANCVHFDNWVLNGTTDSNTDNGTLYAYTYRAFPWTTREIWIYKSASHPTSAPFADSNLVASTSWTGAPASTIIVSQNGSGISGSVDIVSTFYTNETLTLFGSG